jgi:hypothetical protein
MDELNTHPNNPKKVIKDAPADKDKESKKRLFDWWKKKQM